MRDTAALPLSEVLPLQNVVNGLAALPPFAYLEDKLSMHSRHILPSLAERFRIVLVTTDGQIPDAPYADVIRHPGKRWELQCAFQFACTTERLYREGRIAFAYTYNCSGFALRRVPYLHVFGGSFLKNWIEYKRITPWWRRPQLLSGFVHYVVPEAITAWRARIAVAKVEELKRDLVRYYGLPAADVPVITNGVSRTYLDLFRSKASTAKPRIVFTGRLHMDKGILPFVQAFTRHSEIDAQLLVVGDGPQRAAIEACAARDPRVALLGWRSSDEITTILSTTQIFLFPGIIGGYSCSLLEGMASGHACIAYDLPGNREALADAGFFEPVADPEAICRRIAELCTNRALLHEYATRAHERAKGLTWDVFADRLSGVLFSMYERLGIRTPTRG